ncbi:protein MAINTENANCE OF PSII UNDER HIGH LIGHT 1-like [Zingiber officinale]|uniref:protein MAINTENANCE OF PSII UNDER HIGH LIGHT 1-like n=1 Tax=Zingiber officinale TaxID=94328 RepID=UPI001C4D50B6|nr:protein MAINTENANCE OF PSII UNDER HIGH LIGHT 1-like [Zingiber officinale]
MAAGTTARSMVSALLPHPSQSFLGRNPRRGKCVSTGLFFSAAASSSSPDESDCNAEDCAPDKEVGKVSVEWLAAERTKVVGTFPPRNKGWTGYVEKDTAGQTNIYSVEPAVYVADSVISSGTAGTSVDGTGNTVAITAGVALFSIAAASFILVQVGKNQPQVPTVDYSGPPLGYYIDKFKSVSIVEASVPPAPQTSSTAEASAP